MVKSGKRYDNFVNEFVVLGKNLHIYEERKKYFLTFPADF